MQLIIYPNDDDTIAVMTANTKLLANMSMTDIGKKFVPAGKPFKVVDNSDLPEEELWAAWRVDFKKPDGVGGDA